MSASLGALWGCNFAFLFIIHVRELLFDVYLLMNSCDKSLMVMGAEYVFLRNGLLLCTY
jgi:hypothetical protein